MLNTTYINCGLRCTINAIFFSFTLSIYIINYFSVLYILYCYLVDGGEANGAEFGRKKYLATAIFKTRYTNVKMFDIFINKATKLCASPSS